MKNVSSVICREFIKEGLISCFVVINISNRNVYQIKHKLYETTELMTSGVFHFHVWKKC